MNRKYLAETYENTLYANNQCKRWWADPRILVGGSITSSTDWKHLQRAFGIEAVLSVESERDDDDKVTGPYLYVPVLDDGLPKPLEWWKACLEFAKENLDEGKKLYIHGQTGGSRSVAVAYGVLRFVYGFNREEAIEKIVRCLPRYGTHPAHVNYMMSAEYAIEKLTPVAADDTLPA